ncbi:phosphonate C-P lyase system protein PhnG [Ancylobacter terrae]|uniref:phosphonate C-P lyase system protein PhnG n=1 Tax=Ancylobacter sp. sgz301288 TaxID=3342077 RepID=UPI00385B0BD1
MSDHTCQGIEDKGASAAVAARRAVMSTLARADGGELDAMLATLAPLPEVRDLRPPEIGLVMLRGRTGGDGAAFNLGEATVSRAAVRLADGRSGFAYRLGRAPAAARAAAILDALWQGGERAAVERVIVPVAARLRAETAAVKAEVATTKVDFFTLVRGED